MRMTQIKALKLSLTIRQLKYVKESLKWRYLKTVTVDNILYFLWQNNNQILSITTVYNLTDMIMKSHKRPSSTSTSASIIRSIFRDSACKDLPIPVVINVYNAYMSAADIANQCQAAFTTLQSQNSCYWKSLFYWLLDIALVNSYLLAKATSRAIREKSRHCCDHWWFQNALVKILIIYSETSAEHIQIYRSTRTYCAHCQQNQLNWQSKN
jgi:hypothetical protein